MIYLVIPTPQFIEDVEYYKRKKKYRKIDNDISLIVVELENGNLLGDEVQNLHLPDNESTYKVRAANSDMRVGKSNGYRVIYYVVKDDREIFLLTIYSKKDKESITDSEIKHLIDIYCK